MFLGAGFTATGTGDGGTIQLSGTRMGGALWLDAENIRSAADGAVLADLDGTTYAGLPGPGSLAQWLRLLREHTPEYAAQPYPQLAAVHRAAGHDREVRTIVMAQRRDRSSVTPSPAGTVRGPGSPA